MHGAPVIAANCAAKPSSDSAEGGELAHVQAVGDGVDVLEDHDQVALAFPGQRVNHRRRGRARCRQPRRPACSRAGGTRRGSGGVADAHALDAARVVGRDALILARHGKLGMAQLLRRLAGAFGQDVADALAERDLAGHLHHAVGVAPGQAVAVGVAASGCTPCTSPARCRSRWRRSRSRWRDRSCRRPRRCRRCRRWRPPTRPARTRRSPCGP